MSLFNVDIEDVEKQLDDFVDEFDKQVDRAIIQAGRDAQDIIIKDKSFGGNKLRYSTQVETLTDNRIKIKMPSKVATYIEEGTPSHVIRARRKRFLFFYSKLLNRFVYVRSVNHPGQKANPFFTRATVEAHQMLTQRIDKIIEDLTRKFSK